MKECLLFAFALFLFSCGKQDVNPVTSDTPDSIVHLAGNAGGGSYWKNGVYSALNNGASSVNSMTVDGSLVLIGGSVSGGQAVIWKNEEETSVDGGPGGVTLVVSHDNNIFGVWAATGGWVLNKNGTSTPLSPTGWATAMALLGDDALIAGSSQGNEYLLGVSSFYPLDTYAVCWRNEQEIFREKVNSYANTIFIYKEDIYLGGHLNHYPSPDVIACYWKNGQRITLTDEHQDAEVRSLFVTDAHVFAAGVINNQAVYWKDGVATFLSGAGISSKANSISVLGTDVYVAGQEDSHPAVWKNGVKQNFANQDRQGEITVVVAVPNQ